jgi:hypothetical protein
MKTAVLIFVLSTLTATTGAWAQTAPAAPAAKPAPAGPTGKPAPMPLTPKTNLPLRPPDTKVRPPATPAGKKPAAPQAKPAPSKSAAKPAPAAKTSALLIPKDAKQVDASTWHWVDPQGTSWIYRKTPFGINHYRENEETLRAGSAPAPAAGVPADAKAIDASTWRAVDSKGAAWIYKKTPFGINKYREQDAEQRDQAKVAENPARVTDQGDSYKFERSTPFGVETWVRKKGALTEGDKEMLKESQGSAAIASKGQL